MIVIIFNCKARKVIRKEPQRRQIQYFDSAVLSVFLANPALKMFINLLK
jgi:hypothetical protein